MLFGPQMQNQSFFGGGISPQLLQMLQQQGGGMPGAQGPGPAPPPMQGPPGITPQNPVNVPHFMQPPPIQGLDDQSGQMNPLASILGNQGGAMGPQGGIQQLIQQLKQKQQDQQALGGNLSNGMNLPPHTMNLNAGGGQPPQQPGGMGGMSPNIMQMIMSMLHAGGK